MQLVQEVSDFLQYITVIAKEVLDSYSTGWNSSSSDTITWVSTSATWIKNFFCEELDLIQIYNDLR